MGAEAVLTFRPELKTSFRFLQKQAMQTPSKMRFVACQLEALLTESLWQQNARQVRIFLPFLHGLILPITVGKPNG